MLLQDGNLKTDTMAIGNFSMYDTLINTRQQLLTMLDNITNQIEAYKPIVLWQKAESEATSAVIIPNPNCARYIITVLLNSSNITTFSIDADYIGKATYDTNCGISTSISDNNINFLLATVPGTFNNIKIVKIVGMPK